MTNTSTRPHFDRQLNALRDEILLLGSRVQEELKLALDALAALNLDKAREVYAADRMVNKARFDIEEHCFSLIVTQQPAARDLRVIMAAMHMIVDLERMGDQAKGIAKAIPQLMNDLAQPLPELKEMGELVGSMLRQALLAYAHANADLARAVARQDDQVDALYRRVFAAMMEQMATSGSARKAEAAYELLRVARELERFGDLAANVAERTVYLVTGSLDEFNTDQTPVS